MTTHPLAPSLPRAWLRPGQPVHVNAHAAWLPARVISVAHAAIGVSLSTPYAGTLTRTVAPWVVQPADGYRLAPVHQLRCGDEVVAADGSLQTVATPPWRARDGWWVVTYTDGERAMLPPRAVLRLTDPHPNGVDAAAPAAMAGTEQLR